MGKGCPRGASTRHASSRRQTPGSRVCRRRTFARRWASHPTGSTKAMAVHRCAIAWACLRTASTLTRTVPRSRSRCWRSGCRQRPMGTRRTSRSNVDARAASIWRRCTTCCPRGRSSDVGRTNCRTREQIGHGVAGQKPPLPLGGNRCAALAALAASCGPNVFGRMIAMAQRVDDVLRAVESHLPAEFPDVLWTRVTEGMRRHAAQFLRSAP